MVKARKDMRGISRKLLSVFCSALLAFSCCGTPVAYANTLAPGMRAAAPEAAPAIASGDGSAVDGARPDAVAGSASDGNADAGEAGSEKADSMKAGEGTADGEGSPAAEAAAGSAGVSGVDVPGEAQPAGSEGPADDDAPGADGDAGAAVDITEQWRAGTLLLDQAGTYVLSADVTTSGMLVVNAPEDGTVTVDLRGHSVLVAGNVYAGIDASASKDRVVVTDSTRDEDAADAEGAMASKIVVNATKVKGSVAGIMMNVPESLKNPETGADAAPALEVDGIALEVNANTRDVEAEAPTDAVGVYVGYAYEAEARTLDASIGDVCITAAVNGLELGEDEKAALAEDYGEQVIGAEDAGAAIALYATTKGLVLNGEVTTALASAGQVYDVFATVADALVVGEGFKAPEALRVNVAGNEADKTFAHMQDAESSAAPFAGDFADAAENGLVAVAKGAELLFAQPLPVDELQLDLSVDDAVVAAVVKNLADAAAGDEQDEPAAEPVAAGKGISLQMARFMGPKAKLAAMANTVSINETWDAVTGTEGNYGAYVITEPGVYELTGDLDMGTSHIELGRFDMPAVVGFDMDVTIKLNGYTISQRNEASPGGGNASNNWICNAGYGVVQVNKGLEGRTVKLTIDGASASGERGKMNVDLAGNYSHYGMAYSWWSSSMPVVMNVSDVDYTATVSAPTFTSSVEGICGLGSGSGSSLNVRDCSINYEGTVPTNTTGSPTFTGVDKSSAFPTTFDNVKVSAKSSQRANLSGFCLKGGTTADNTIRDCTVELSAPNRIAAQSQTGSYFSALTACNATVTGSLNVTLTTGNPTGTNSDKLPVGIGVYPASNTTVLDCDYTYACNGGQCAALAVANSTTDGRYITFGPNFRAKTQLTEVMCNNASFGQTSAIYEDAGFWLAKFSETPSEAQIANLQDNLKSLAGSIVKVNETGVTYAVAEADAVAELLLNGVHMGYYKVMNAGLRNDCVLTNGYTVKLLKDGSTYTDVFQPMGGSAGDTVTLDVNGHKCFGLSNQYYAGSNLRVIDSSEGKTGSLSNATSTVPLTAYASAGTVTVEGVPVSNTYNGTTYPITIANGSSVVLNNAAVEKKITNNTGEVAAINYSPSAKSRLVVNGGSIKVSSTGGASTNPMSAIRLQVSSSAEVDVDIEGCDITVDAASTSQNHKAIGVNAGMSVTGGTVNLTMKGKEDGSSAVNVTSAKGTAIGVMAAGNVKTSISDYQLKPVVTDSSTTTTAIPASYPREVAYSDKLSTWAASATFSNEATNVTFGGKMKMSGGFAFKSTATLAADFEWDALSEKADKSVKVYNQNLIPFASASSSADLSALAGKLIGAGGTFDECEAVVFSSANKSRLRWNATGEAVAKNVTAGFDYPTLDAALNSVSPGDTVELLQDVTLEEMTKVYYTTPTSFTFDLKGYTMNLGKVEANARAHYAGIELAGGAQVRFTDSGRTEDGNDTLIKGGLNFKVGTTAAVGNSTNNIDRAGILVSGTDAGVTLDGVKTDVTVVGRQNIGYSKVYAGVLASGANSKVELAGDTQLTVTWTDDGLTDAIKANNNPFGRIYGVYSAGSGDAAVTVGPDVNVTASDGGQPSETGSIADSTTVSNVVEVHPQPGTAQYEEIQRKFAAGATFDAADDSSTGFGNKVYWWTGRLDDGTTVIAYSDVVPDDQVGKPDAIVATHIFQQTKYGEVVEAAGVYLSPSFAGKANVQGSYNVNAPYGNAYGVYAAGTADAVATVGTAAFDVQGGNLNYLARGDRLNVTSVVDGLNPVDPCFYPYSSRSAAPYLVQRASTVAYGVFSATAADHAEAAKVVLAGKVKSQASGRESADIRVTEPFYLASGFGLQDDAAKLGVLMAAQGQETNAEFAVFAKGEGSYVPTAADAACFADVADQYSSGTGDGGLAWGEGFTVKFLIDGSVVQENARLVAGQTVPTPTKAITDKYDNTGASEYKFLGWSKTEGATSVNAAAGDLDASAATFTAAEAMTYHAVYEKVPKHKKVIVTGLKDGEGNAVADVEFDLKNGETLVAALTRQGKSTPVSAASYGTSQFVGWVVTGPTSTSAGTMYNTTTLFDPLDIWGLTADFSSTQDVGTFPNTTSYNNSDTVKLWAAYRAVAANQVKLTFKNGGLLQVWVGAQNASPVASGWGSPALSNSWLSIARSGQADTYPAYSSASGSSGVSSGTNINGTTYKFAGWYAGYSSNPVVTSEEPATYPFGDTATATNANRKYVDPIIPNATAEATYTAKYTVTQQQVPVTVYGYAKDGDGYAYGQQASFTRPSGTTTLTDATDPYVEDKFVWEGDQYEFLGWSVRQSDEQPLYAKGEPLPALSGTMGTGYNSTLTGPTYYAIYSKTPVAGTVEFFNGSTRYATATDQAGTTTLDDAFASLKMDPPTSEEPGKVLVGWSATQGATAPDVSASGVAATVGSVASAQGLYMPFTIKVYAVYADEYTYAVTFYEVPGADGADTSNRSVIKGPIAVPEGATVESTGKAPTDPVRAGSYFYGWNTAADGSGDDFSADATQVKKDYDVYAVFKEITAETGASGAQVDLGSMYLNDTAGESARGAQSVTVSVGKESKRDGNLAYTGHSDYEGAGTYTVKVAMKDANGSESELTSGFNAITLKLPVDKRFVSAGNQVVVRWLKNDGTVGTSALKTPVAQPDGSGVVELSIDGYSPSAMGGNIAVFAKPTDAQVAESKVYDNAIEALDKAYATYREADYKASDWRKLTDAYNNAKQAVLDSATVDEVEASANGGLQAMAAVPKDNTADLERAKSMALNALATSFANYDKRDYDETNWAKLIAAYNDAKTNVQNAEEPGDATGAGEAGVAAMSAVPKAADGANGADGASGADGANGTRTTSTTTTTAQLPSSSGSGLSGGLANSALGSNGGSGLSNNSLVDASLFADGAGTTTAKDGSMLVLPDASSALSSALPNAGEASAADSAADGSEPGGLIGWIHHNWIPFWIIVALLLLAIAAGVVAALRSRKGDDGDGDSDADSAPGQDGEISFS